MIGVNPGRLFNPATLPHGVANTLLTNIVAYWKYDENTGTTVGDSASTKNGTWNTASWLASGLINSGGDFTSGTKDVDMGNVLGFDRTQAMSWSFWIKSPGVGGDYVVLGKINTTGNGTGYDIHLNGRTVYLHLAGSGASITDLLQVRFDASAFLGDGSWHHCVYTYDGSSTAAGCGLSIDNVPRTLVTDFNTLHAAITNAGAFRHGATNTGTSFLVANLDEIGMWTTVLSANNITALYNSGAGLSFANFH